MSKRTIAIAVASLRVLSNVALTGAAAYAALASPDAAPGTIVAGRSILLAAAIGLRAAVGGTARTRRRVDVAGVGLDLASVLLGGWRVLIVPAGAGAQVVVLATAEVVLAAAVLALAVAHLVVRSSLERHALRTTQARRARIEARRERLEGARHDAQARAELGAQLVAHDLRNPLAVVLAHLRLVHAAIARMPELASEVESLEVASGEALRLSGMIGDLLLVPRIERGELRGQFSAVAVRDVLDAVARATHPHASAKALRVEVAAPQALVAWIDADLVRRMVENLVSNALRYTPDGGSIELAAHVEGERLRVAVRNSGTPVPAGARARLFEKYATLGPGRENNGLGLYLCRLVSEVHGGRIALVERQGWNVSFEADLPLAGRGVRESAP